MKKVTLLPILLCFLCGANAQNWFTNNPVWNDYLNNPAGYGYSKYFIGKDTLVNGILCKKIINQAVMGSYWDTTQYGQSANYLYEEGNVVFFFAEFPNAFDTLYNFGASPGDKWEINTACYSDSLPYVKVLDTGFSSINNTNLKWLYVQYHNLDWGDDYVTDTIYDKMGSKYAGLFFQGLGCQSYYTSFCSYYDDSIGLYPSNAQHCDTAFFSAVSALEANEETKIFPNPVRDFLILSNFFNKKGELEIIDVLGRVVLTENSVPPVIDVSGLETGMYLMVIRDITPLKVIRFIKM